MNFVDMILILLLVVIFILAVRKCLCDSRSGKGCMGNCAACDGCASRKKKKEFG